MIPEVTREWVMKKKFIILNEIYTLRWVEYLGYKSTLDRLTYVNVEVRAASYEILGKNF